MEPRTNLWNFYEVINGCRDPQYLFLIAKADFNQDDHLMGRNYYDDGNVQMVVYQALGANHWLPYANYVWRVDRKKFNFSLVKQSKNSF